MSPVILVVDDDPNVIELIGVILSELGRVRFATSGEQALALCRQTPPDLMLLDSQLGGLGTLDGLQVLQQLQTDPLLADLPVIMVTSHDEEALEVAALDHGAVDFIAKPVRAATLLARVRTQLKVRSLTRELRDMATRDGLTGVANRRAFDQALQREWRQAQRQRGTLALLMLDVDFFKRYNDALGHPAGDACLQALARLLGALARRPGDLAARYGGEEFVLLLPGTDRLGAWQRAELLCRQVEQLALPHPDSAVAPHVTLSIGLACLQVGEGMLPEQLLQAADQALYSAKQQGRARICGA